MARPWMTIDFKGLCAFVTDKKKRRKANKLHVLMVDTDQAAPEEELCRHDPMVVFRGQKDFIRAASSEHHASFSSLDGTDYGFWNVAGKDLVLDQLAPGTKRPLKIRKSFEKVLSLGRLNGDDGQVHPDSVAAAPFPAAGSRLTIDHGRIKAFRWSGRWGLATPDGDPGSGDWMRFRQIVRWQVYAEPEDAHLRLAAKPEDAEAEAEEWILLEEGAHLVISNLCPLSPGERLGKDILAYYAFCKTPVPQEERYVLHPPYQESGLAGAGEPVRPGVDACPPLSGYLEP